MAAVALDTLYAPVRKQAELLRTRKLTSEDLTSAYLERLTKIGPKLGAVVTVMKDHALKQAKAADGEIRAGKYRGVLHGIPYGVKDLLATKDAPTTWGAEPFKKQQFNTDATIIQKLTAAGAVLIGKLAMVELAGGFGYGTADASFTGPGRTPWNTDYWSGGSSSGSGASVAAALVSFAIGSETNGSIVSPCSACGISGLRPTYGRVSRHGAMALCWTLDKLGPMARSADCCGIVLAAIAGKDKLDASSVGKTFRYPEEKVPKSFTIGVVADATRNVQPEVKKNFEAALDVLGKSAKLVKDVKLPDLPYGETFMLILRAEGAAAFHDLIVSGDTSKLKAPNDRWGGQAAMSVLAVDYIRALQARGPIRQALNQVFAKYDAIIAPGTSTVAYPVGVDFSKAYPRVFNPAISRLLTASNVVGLPAMCLPTGPGLKGLPTSMQLVGKAWSEPRLLSIAKAYQDATTWHTKRPPEVK